MRTLTDMRKFVRYMIDEKVETFWEDNELDLFINFEYNNLAHEIIATSAGYYEEDTTVACTSGDPIVALPANHAGKVIHVMYGDKILSPKTEKEITLANRTSAPGEPSMFAIFGKNLYLSPAPVSAFSLPLRHAYMPPDLVAVTNETPDFPLGFEILMPLGTVIYALLKDKQELDRIMVRYNDIKGRMLVSLKSRQTWEPRRVREV